MSSIEKAMAKWITEPINLYKIVIKAKWKWIACLKVLLNSGTNFQSILSKTESKRITSLNNFRKWWVIYWMLYNCRQELNSKKSQGITRRGILSENASFRLVTLTELKGESIAILGGTVQFFWVTISIHPGSGNKIILMIDRRRFSLGVVTLSVFCLWQSNRILSLCQQISFFRNH